MSKIVLASNNNGKLLELQAMLSSLSLQVLPQSFFDIDDAVEDGLSFVENAIIKARHAARLSGLPALADDSGLAVDFLNGEPGIFSARFAGENAADADNNKKLLELLRNVPTEKRTAQFHCVLAFLRHASDPAPLIAHGVWAGHILQAPLGENGFGYDPLFWVAEHQCSSAQLSKIEKNSISHRARAMQHLLHQLTVVLQ
jgi:XTP/dITP diphosphohydrolase